MLVGIELLGAQLTEQPEPFLSSTHGKTDVTQGPDRADIVTNEYTLRDNRKPVLTPQTVTRETACCISKRQVLVLFP